METKYDGYIVERDVFNKEIKRIINLIYKLLPMREEGQNWIKPLETILEELMGMNRLFIDLQSDLFTVICKLEGLFELTAEKDMSLYRRTIFECLSLLGRL